MSLNHHPTEGVRLLIELQETDDGTIRYLGNVFTPDAKFTYQISIGDEGKVTLEPELAATEEDEAKLKKMTESIARKAIKDGGQWPERILRWRGPGRG